MSATYVLLLFCVTLCHCDRPQVKTPYGTFRGEVIKSKSGKELLAFKGIPYAQPPVGKLRYKDPVKLEPNDGTYDANKEVVCLQTINYVESFKDNQTKYFGQEDCLYLYIYVTKRESKDLLPVYVWIHGGSFIIGSGTEIWSSPVNIVDDGRDMVMITLNYRLGVLGFLSVDDEILPGNLGLKDQVMALRWIKENIQAFGGDANAITLGGISAGAATVSHHLNSKLSKGLFHRAISQGGTADCLWARKSTHEARQLSSLIVASLNCSTDKEKLLNCLQDLPANSIIDSLDKLNIPEVAGLIQLTPVIEKESPNAFMTKESIEEGSDIPWLAGITNEEGLLFYHFMVGAEPRYKDMSILKSDGKRLLPIIGYYSAHPDPNKITQDLSEYYFKDGFSEDTAKNFVQLLSDLMFNHGLHMSGKNYNGKLYQYMISYKGQHTVSTLRPKGTENGVGHGDDVFYFFPRWQSVPEWKPLTGKDLQFSNQLMNIWYDFIKTGNPTPVSGIWEESDKGKKYLDLTGDELVMKTHFFKERMDFLDKIQVSAQAQEQDK